MAAAEERRRADMGYDGPSDYSSTLACIVGWLGRRGPSLPRNGCALLEAGERHD
jgi:hypothetical protein